jgi:hypothetical protein
MSGVRGPEHRRFLGYHHIKEEDQLEREKRKADIIFPLRVLEGVSVFVQTALAITLSLISYSLLYGIWTGVLCVLNILSMGLVMRIKANGAIDCSSVKGPQPEKVKQILWGRVWQKLTIFVIGGVWIWLRAFMLKCDGLGEGQCIFGFTSLASQSSCWSGEFSLNPATGQCESALPKFTSLEQARTYNPVGQFPKNGQYYTKSAFWGYCYMDQHWGIDLTNQTGVQAYHLNNDDLIDCDNPYTSPLSVPIPGCNGPLCPNSYQNQNFGLSLSTPQGGPLVPPLTTEASNGTGGIQLCPGILAGRASYWTPEGQLLPINSPLPKNYIKLENTPLPICPVCLWYWMTQVAGTLDNPYQDPQMELILQQCLNQQGGGERVTTATLQYQQQPTTWCGICPERQQRAPNLPPSPGQQEKYDPSTLGAVFWLLTTFVFFEPLGWLVMFYYLRQFIPILHPK